VAELIDYQGGQPEQWLATIGDIAISQRWVLTPTGTYPIRGSVWTVTDMSHYEESVSTVGVVLAILFVWFCLLGLLFLLMKDRRLGGLHPGHRAGQRVLPLDVDSSRGASVDYGRYPAGQLRAGAGCCGLSNLIHLSPDRLGRDFHGLAI
jgi:hypothetical protein